MTDKSLATKIITGGAILGVVVAALGAWGTYGWITKQAYASDHEGATIEEQQIAILKSLENNAKALTLIQADIVKNQDQWECDETDEELEDIEFHLLEEATTAEKVQLRRAKVKLEEVWEAKKCTRFTD